MSHLSDEFKAKVVAELEKFLHGDTGRVSIWAIKFSEHPVPSTEHMSCSVMAVVDLDPNEIELSFTDPLLDDEEDVIFHVINQVALAIGIAYSYELLTKAEEALVPGAYVLGS